MYIYITRNKINNKKYIGLSARNSKYHKKYLGSGVLLQKAIKKYGRHNFKKTILEDNIYTFNLLCEKERYYITKYNAVLSPDYYNIEEGGISTSFWNIISDDEKIKVKNKISNSLKEYYKENPMDKETIKKIVNSLNQYNHIRYETEFEIYDEIYITKTFDELDKYKRRNSYKLWIKDKYDVLEYFRNRYLNYLSDKQKKIIYKFDLDGELICKYESLDDAVLDTKVTKSNMSLAAQKKRNNAGGFRWSYTDTPNDLFPLQKTGRKKGTKNSWKIERKHTNIKINEVLIYDTDMKLLKTVLGYVEAAEYTGLSHQMISKKCRSEELYKGYYFRKGKQIKKTIVK